MLRKLPLVLLVAACGSVEQTPEPVGLPDAGPTPDSAVVDMTPDAADPPPPPPSNVPGKYTHTLVVDGMNREVIVYVPEGATGPTPVRAVVVYHGTSGDGERFYNISGWKKKSDEVGIISVYGTAMIHCFYEDENLDGDFADPGERKVTTKWSHGKLGDVDRMPLCSADEIAALPPDKRALADHPQADDLAYTNAVLDLLVSQYAVDPAHIYASGFSNGAGMTSRLAVEMTDRFAAVASSGGVLQVDTKASRAIPVIFTVGEVDDRFTTGLGVAALPMTEDLIHMDVWKAVTVTPYLQALQLEDSYVYNERTILDANGQNPSKVISFTYLDSPLGAPNGYAQVVVQGLGHQYANGINHPVVYADELWNFFKRY